MSITIGARASKLSIKQVEEVIFGIKYYYPDYSFIVKCTATKGDKDQETSLKELEKTNFFTKEIDEWLLNGDVRIAVHSAKDLPDPLPKGLQMVALTKCVNSEDVLVLPPKVKISQLKSKAIIATSSKRRENNVSKLLPHCSFVDLRGPIEKRLEKLEKREVDGVVMAKAALLRLNLTSLNMIQLPGEVCPNQGALAVLARVGDQEMKKIFSSIDTRKQKKSLYLGLNPLRYMMDGTITHYPIIRIKPRPIEEFANVFALISKYSHVVFTSQVTVDLFLEYAEKYKIDKSELSQKNIIALGEATGSALQLHKVHVDYLARKETLEGVIELFEHMKLKKGSKVLLPRSSGGRPNLIEFFQKNSINFRACDLYDTESICPSPKPNVEDFDELVFTSPSCIRSYFEHFKTIPESIKIVFKGDVTKDYFNKYVITNLL